LRSASGPRQAGRAEVLKMKVIKCENCHKKLSPGVVSFSLRRFGRYLCMKCQQKERLLDMPPKIAKFINEEVRKKYGRLS